MLLNKSAAPCVLGSPGQGRAEKGNATSQRMIRIRLGRQGSKLRSTSRDHIGESSRETKEELERFQSSSPTQDRRHRGDSERRHQPKFGRVGDEVGIRSSVEVAADLPSSDRTVLDLLHCPASESPPSEPRGRVPCPFIRSHDAESYL